MKQSKFNLLVLLGILAVSIAISIWLTKQNQEVRRKAAGEAYRQYFEPVGVSMKVGETAVIKAMVQSSTEFDGTTLVLCYPKDYLAKITGADIKWGSSFDTSQSILREINTADSSKLCVQLDAMISYKEETKKPSGTVEVASITLKGLKEGGNLKVEVMKDQLKDVVTDKIIQSIIVGTFDPQKPLDTVRYFDSVGEVLVTINGKAVKYSRGACDFTKGLYSCQADENGTMDLANCQKGDAGCYQAYSHGSSSTDCDAVTGNWICKIDGNSRKTLSQCQIDAGCDINGDNYVLKFKVVYPGVNKDSQCDNGYDQVKVTVESPTGEVWKSDKVKLQKTTETKDIGENQPVIVYQGEVALTGFNYNEKLSVMIKGPKHLGLVYGKNGQTECYKDRVGTIGGLTKNSATTPVWDFTTLPLPPGDIFENNLDLVNGQDYSTLKEAINKGTSANPQADLNGDCIINAADATYLLNTVSQKCGDWF